MDWGWFKSVDEGTFPFYSCLYMWCWCMIGIHCRYCRACPISNCTMLIDIHGSLLHILLKRYYCYSPQGCWKSSWQIPWSLLCFCWCRCSVEYVFASPTCTPPLHYIDSLVWITKWTLLVNYRVEEYQSRQGTLATVESLQGAYPNALNNNSFGQDCSSLASICPIRHACRYHRFLYCTGLEQGKWHWW